MTSETITGWKPDTCGRFASWGHTWEPRTKSLAAFVFIICVVGSQSLPFVLVSLALTIAAALTMRLPWHFIAARLTWIFPFIIIMAATLTLSNGFPPSMDGLVFSALITFKVLTSVMVMILTLSTQPLQEYFDGIAHVGLPPLLISVLFLTFRYIFLFRDEMQSTRRALNARAFQSNAKGKSLTTYGELAGGMFLKALDRSETVYQAMSARGFDGKLRSGKPRPITKIDILKSSAVLTIAALVVIQEGRWLW